MEQRLQQIIARAGVASRRKAESLIVEGRVRVNGRVVQELGTKANPFSDRIELDGRRLVVELPYYVVLHKPRNVVSTMRDPEGRPTVAEHVGRVQARIFPVGRLDFATSGVLLMTNDGDFSQALLHPKKEVPKTYIVKVAGLMQPEDMRRWQRGVELDDGITAPAKLHFLRHEEDKTWFELTIVEGRNQQIRRMGDATGFRVMRLARASFAGIGLDGLRPGEYRALTKTELVKLREAYGVPRKLRPALASAAKIHDPAEAAKERRRQPRKPRDPVAKRQDRPAPSRGRAESRGEAPNRPGKGRPGARPDAPSAPARGGGKRTAARRDSSSDLPPPRSSKGRRPAGRPSGPPPRSPSARSGRRGAGPTESASPRRAKRNAR